MRRRILALAALLVADACGEQPADIDALLEQHGYACIVFWAHDILAVTASIEATVSYSECLVEFYTQVRPDLRADQPTGAALLDAARARLCGPDAAAPGAPCAIEPAGFTQQFGADGHAYLTIRYDIPDPAALRDRPLLWGPAPLEALAGCRPTVSLVPIDPGITGYDADGAPRWRMHAFHSPFVDVAQQPTVCMEAMISPVDPN